MLSLPSPHPVPTALPLDLTVLAPMEAPAAAEPAPPLAGFATLLAAQLPALPEDGSAAPVVVLAADKDQAKPDQAPVEMAVAIEPAAAVPPWVLALVPELANLPAPVAEPAAEAVGVKPASAGLWPPQAPDDRRLVTRLPAASPARSNRWQAALPAALPSPRLDQSPLAAPPAQSAMAVEAPAHRPMVAAAAPVQNAGTDQPAHKLVVQPPLPSDQPGVASRIEATGPPTKLPDPVPPPPLLAATFPTSVAMPSNPAPALLPAPAAGPISSPPAAASPPVATEAPPATLVAASKAEPQPQVMPVPHLPEPLRAAERTRREPAVANETREAVTMTAVLPAAIAAALPPAQSAPASAAAPQNTAQLPTAPQPAEAPALAIASDRLGDVAVRLSGGPDQLQVTMQAQPAAAVLIGAEAPRLSQDLANAGVSLAGLSVNGQRADLAGGQQGGQRQRGRRGEDDALTGVRRLAARAPVTRTVSTSIDRFA